MFKQDLAIALAIVGCGAGIPALCVETNTAVPVFCGGIVTEVVLGLVAIRFRRPLMAAAVCISGGVVIALFGGVVITVVIGRLVSVGLQQPFLVAWGMWLGSAGWLVSMRLRRCYCPALAHVQEEQPWERLSVLVLLLGAVAGVIVFAVSALASIIYESDYAYGFAVHLAAGILVALFFVVPLLFQTFLRSCKERRERRRKGAK